MISKNGLNELSKKLAKTHAIAGILFGSIARGDYDKRSDVDILLIYARKEELEKDKITLDEIPTLNGREVQVVARTIDELRKSDKVFLRSVFREGKLLFVKEPIDLEACKLLGLNPYRIFIYSMENLDTKDKKKLLSALYGYSTRKKVGKREYSYTYHGIKDIQKLGKNSLLVPETSANEVENLLKSYKIEYRSIMVWVED